MERFSIEGKELVKHFDPKTLLGTIFSQIEKELQTSNQVVCQFIVDGIPLREAEEKRFARIPIGSIHKLEYLAENSYTLTIDVLNTWIEGLPDLQLQIEVVSDRLRQDGILSTLGPIQKLISNIQAFTSSLVSLRGTLGDMAAGLEIDWKGNEMRLLNAMRSTIDASEKKNYRLLADILEYDLMNAIAYWGQDLKRIKEFVDGDASGKSSTNSQSSSVGGVRRTN